MPRAKVNGVDRIFSWNIKMPKFGTHKCKAHPCDSLFIVDFANKTVYNSPWVKRSQ